MFARASCASCEKSLYTQPSIADELRVVLRYHNEIFAFQSKKQLFPPGQRATPSRRARFSSPVSLLWMHLSPGHPRATRQRCRPRIGLQAASQVVMHHPALTSTRAPFPRNRWKDGCKHARDPIHCRPKPRRRIPILDVSVVASSPLEIHTLIYKSETRSRFDRPTRAILRGKAAPPPSAAQDDWTGCTRASAQPNLPGNEFRPRPEQQCQQRKYLLQSPSSAPAPHIAPSPVCSIFHMLSSSTAHVHRKLAPLNVRCREHPESTARDTRRCSAMLGQAAARVPCRP